MTTDESLATIPTGWRFYTCDASIVGRYSVTLRQIDHIGYVSAQGPTIADAIQTAAIKAKWHWRGWTIEHAYIGYEASHPDHEASYEGPEDGWVGNGLHVHGMTVEDVKAQIDDKIEEMGE